MKYQVQFERCVCMSAWMLTLLAGIAHQFITPPSGFALVHIPVSRIIHRACIYTRLRRSTHRMAVWSAPVGIDHMLKCRVLSLLTLQTQKQQVASYHINMHACMYRLDSMANLRRQVCLCK